MPPSDPSPTPPSVTSPPAPETAPSPSAPVRADPKWLIGGAACLVIAAGVIIIPAHTVAAHNGSDIFKAADGFASLAGFTFLAAALERIAEFTLAPWWGKVGTERVTTAISNSRVLSTRITTAPASSEGVSGAARLRAKVRDAQPDPDGPASDAAKAAAKQAADAADSVYVQATKQRPTIMLPMAAGAAIACSFMHLYLLHSLAKSGLPNTTLAFVADGLLTGIALSGGAQPFHDLVGSLSPSATSKQKASSTG